MNSLVTATVAAGTSQEQNMPEVGLLRARVDDGREEPRPEGEE